MNEKEIRDFLEWLASIGVTKIYVYQCIFKDGSIEHQVECVQRPTNDFKHLVFEGDLNDVWRHRYDEFTNLVDHTFTLAELVMTLF